MSQIKELQPKEGVTLLAVKVEPDSYEFSIRNGVLMARITPKTHSETTLPEGNWQLLGKATEIPEEVWQGIVSKVIVNGDTYYGYIDDNRELHTFDTATEAGISFLVKYEVYGANPYIKPCHLTAPDNEIYGDVFFKWQQAQSNTGTWVMLQRV